MWMVERMWMKEGNRNEERQKKESYRVGQSKKSEIKAGQSKTEKIIWIEPSES